jgi:S-adenosylmethionine synthetase
MVGRIGNDLSKPLAFSLLTEERIDSSKKRDIVNFINEELSKISNITEKIVEGKFTVC